MRKDRVDIIIGVGMIVLRAVMYLLFGRVWEIETPVIGLRQVGVVIAVLGAVELSTVPWRRATGKVKQRSDG